MFEQTLEYKNKDGFLERQKLRLKCTNIALLVF